MNKIEIIKEAMLKEIQEKHSNLTPLIYEYYCIPEDINGEIFFYREEAHANLDTRLNEVEAIVSQMFNRLKKEL